eukprot:scaffold266_cov248-Pinguiococcus_pyrenoidosus.AAC.27
MALGTRFGGFRCQLMPGIWVFVGSPVFSSIFKRSPSPASIAFVTIDMEENRYFSRELDLAPKKGAKRLHRYTMDPSEAAGSELLHLGAFASFSTEEKGRESAQSGLRYPPPAANEAMPAFMGPAEAIRACFTMPYRQESSSIALHKMGGTLLVDVGGPEDPENLPALAPQALFAQLLERDEDDNAEDASSFRLEPARFVPEAARPFRQLLDWQYHEMKLLVGTNLVTLPDGSGTRMHMLDLSRPMEICTCLDIYLDNVMANIPELALCMHAKGFLRGVTKMRTVDIPWMGTGTSSQVRPSQAKSGQVKLSRAKPWKCCTRECCTRERRQSAAGKRLTLLRSCLYFPSLTPLANPSSFGFPVGDRSAQPIFSAADVDMTASALLRFLKSNCNREGGTYILHREAADEADDSQDDAKIRLYDVTALGMGSQRRWKWLLGMLCYRFAVRIAQHLKTPPNRSLDAKFVGTMMQRQRSLFQTAFDLLHQLRSE